MNGSEQCSSRQLTHCRHNRPPPKTSHSANSSHELISLLSITPLHFYNIQTRQTSNRKPNIQAPTRRRNGADCVPCFGYLPYPSSPSRTILQFYLQHLQYSSPATKMARSLARSVTGGKGEASGRTSDMPWHGKPHPT